jgi:hypothetical protein
MIPSHHPYIDTHHPYIDTIHMNTIEDQEAQSLRGGVGVVESILVGIAIGATLNLLDNWDSFKAGLMGYPDPTSKRIAR